MKLTIVRTMQCSELSDLVLDGINGALNIYGSFSATMMEPGRTITDVESLHSILETGRECRMDAYNVIKATYEACLENDIEEVVFCK